MCIWPLELSPSSDCETPSSSSPSYFSQLCYKLAWFVFVVVPLLVSGRFPGYAVLTAVIFATYVVGDLIAIPFSYVLTSHGRPGVAEPATGGDK